jgi:HSP20 family protein
MRNNNSKGREYLPATMRSGNNDWSLLPSMGDLFQSFFQPSFLGSNTGNAMPALDLKENAEDYSLAVDVPGFSMDQINLQLADNVLTISAERPSEADGQASPRDSGEESRWHIIERLRGAFSRSIKFPVAVDAAKVKAQLRSGVLLVTVPKAADARAQKIRITEA